MRSAGIARVAANTQVPLRRSSGIRSYRGGDVGQGPSRGTGTQGGALGQRARGGGPDGLLGGRRARRRRAAPRRTRRSSTSSNAVGRRDALDAGNDPPARPQPDAGPRARAVLAATVATADQIRRQLTMEAALRFRAMGTNVHLVVVDGDGDAKLLERARARIEDLELRWSRFLPDTELDRAQPRCRLGSAHRAQRGHVRSRRAARSTRGARRVDCSTRRSFPRSWPPGTTAASTKATGPTSRATDNARTVTCDDIVVDHDALAVMLAAGLCARPRRHRQGTSGRPRRRGAHRLRRRHRRLHQPRWRPARLRSRTRRCARLGGRSRGARGRRRRDARRRPRRRCARNVEHDAPAVASGRRRPSAITSSIRARMSPR